MSRFIYLIKLINQLKQQDNGNQRCIDVNLELSIMAFISRFKSAVLGDPRLILLGSTAFEESLGKRLDEEPEDDSKIPDYISPY